jgi:hypothetical protein
MEKLTSLNKLGFSSSDRSKVKQDLVLLLAGKLGVMMKCKLNFAFVFSLVVKESSKKILVLF